MTDTTEALHSALDGLRGAVIVAKGEIPARLGPPILPAPFFAALGDVNVWLDKADAALSRDTPEPRQVSQPTTSDTAELSEYHTPEPRAEAGAASSNPDRERLLDRYSEGFGAGLLSARRRCACSLCLTYLTDRPVSIGGEKGNRPPPPPPPDRG